MRERSQATHTGVTFSGMSGDAITIDNDATLEVEDVGVRDGTATIDVSSGGGRHPRERRRPPGGSAAGDQKQSSHACMASLLTPCPHGSSPRSWWPLELR